MAASVVKDSVKMENSKRSFSLDENRLNCLKADIHSKGSLLSSTWNDLYRLLSQYQSELFVSDAPRGDTELRRDIVKKDAQLSELQHKLSLAETEIERVRLDLTVKNSLLQKYQDDLLDKEAALMTCQATIRKLENKHQLLENRMNVKTVNHEVIPHHDDEEDRKPPKGSLINASISAISQKRKLNSVNSSSKRKSRTPAQKSPANDLLQEVIDDVIENNHTGLDAETKQELKECLNSTPMNESVFPEPEEAPLPLEQYENWQNDALAQATGEVITSSKKSSRWEDPLRRHACPHCSKNFTRPKDVKRHVNTVHLKLKSYGCPSCDKRFTRKEHSVRHLARCLGNYGIPYDASLIETYQRTKPDDEYVRISGGFNQGGPEADRAENGYDSAKFSAETAIFPEMYDPNGYPCPTCFRIFTRQTHRKRHIDTMHSQVKRHQCTECGRAFARKDYLTKHFIAHHPDLCGDFVCGICGRKCLCQDEMDTHIYQCHSVLEPVTDEVPGDLSAMIEEMKDGLAEMEGNNDDVTNSLLQTQE